MPDTTIREGWLQPGSPSYSDDWLVYGRAPRKTDEPCVVVTGRTAQEIEDSLAFTDALVRHGATIRLRVEGVASYEWTLLTGGSAVGIHRMADSIARAERVQEADRA